MGDIKGITNAMLPEMPGTCARGNNVRPLEKESYNHLSFVDEIGNWPRGQGLLVGHTYLPPLAIALAKAIYGGLHAAA